MTTLGDSAVGHESIRRPALGLLLLEGRAVLEVAALLAIAGPMALALRARAAARECRRG